MEKYINVVAVLVAALALFVSYLSLRAAMLGVRASTFDRRYEIYADAEKFLGTWMRDGHPDMDKLGLIVGAWSRSHFLCRREVTSYLKKVWHDAVRAAYLRQVMKGEVEGDHGKAVDEFHALLQYHVGFDRLRTIFVPDLGVVSGVATFLFGR